MNLTLLWEKAVAAAPEKVAIYYPPRNAAHTFRQIDQAVARMANSLVGLGLAKGDRVGIYARNHPEWWVTYLAVLKAGAVVVPLNFMFKSEEIQHIAGDSGIKMIVSESDLMPHIEAIRESLPALEQIVLIGGKAMDGANSYEELVSHASDQYRSVDCDPDDLASIIYTSGTTGLPKGAMLTHSNIAWAVTNLARSFEMKVSDVWMQVVPLAHVSGQMWGMSVLFFGASLVRMDRFEPENYCQAVVKYGATGSDGVVTIVQALLNYPDAPHYLKSLTRVADGGAPMPPDAFEEFESRFGIKIVDFYGLTETTLLAVRLPMEAPRRRGSCGLAAPQTQIRIFDEADRQLLPGEIGEVVIQGPQVMKGYWQNPTATAEAMACGWFHTGDYGYLDPEGYLYIVDRKKDIILMSAWSIYPREIEEVLLKHPKIREAAVIAVPDKTRGEIPVAVISLQPDVTATAEEITLFCRDRMASYKCPRGVEFVDSLPRAGGGWKILKRDLRAQFAPKYAAMAEEASSK